MTGTLARLHATAARKELEDLMAYQLRTADVGSGWQRQYAAVTDRRWRWDYAWPDHLLLLEIDGGTWSGGAHTRGRRIEQDAEKQTAAAIAGWRTMRVTGDQVRTGQALAWVERALRATP